MAYGTAGWGWAGFRIHRDRDRRFTGFRQARHSTVRSLAPGLEYALGPQLGASGFSTSITFLGDLHANYDRRRLQRQGMLLDPSPIGADVKHNIGAANGGTELSFSDSLSLRRAGGLFSRRHHAMMTLVPLRGGEAASDGGLDPKSGTGRCAEPRRQTPAREKTKARRLAVDANPKGEAQAGLGSEAAD